MLLTARTKGVAVDPAAFLAAPAPVPTLAAGERLELGGVEARIIPCPGHTPGSVVVHIPEKKLLLTGDDWNICTWLFFPEALGIKAYRENLRGLLKLPFEHVLCPHRSQLYARSTLKAFADGLTDAAIAAAPSTDTGAPYGVHTREIPLPEEQVIVFDGEKI